MSRFTLWLIIPGLVALVLAGCSGEFRAFTANTAGTAGSAPLDDSGGENAGAAQGGSAAAGTVGATNDAGAAPDDGSDLPAVLGQEPDAPAIQLQPVVTSGLPEFAVLTNYDADEASASQTTPPRDIPLYQPYDSHSPEWWDNLVAEELQARISIVGLPTRGAYTLDTADTTGPGDENPRRLSAWSGAIERANATTLVSALCVVDTPYLQLVANRLHARAADTPFDLADKGDYADVLWQRVVAPWFASVPRQYWFTAAGQPVIALSALPAVGFVNASGNASLLLTALAASFHAAYGTDPVYLLDASWFSADTTVSDTPYVAGKVPWFSAPTAASSFASYKNNTFGSIVPGFASPAYYDPTSAQYHDPSRLIPRSTPDNYGEPVVTLLSGLTSAVDNAATLTFIEGFDDYQHWSALYRSKSSAWRSPNQYLNLLRRNLDPQTASLRLEAEGCDRYLDTTPGNSGGSFRRGGDLDVRALSAGGWAVTGSAAGEWLEFDGLDFSAGNYQFSAHYATSGMLGAAPSKRLQLVIDDQPLPPTLLTETASSDNFANVVLGEQAMNHGQHTLRVRFLDGRVDLDWLFVSKRDPLVGLQAANQLWVSADNGGGSTVFASGPRPSIFESFRLDGSTHAEPRDDDSVFIQAANGLFLSVAPDTLAVSATSRTPGPQQKFILHVKGGGSAATGSVVAFEFGDRKHYLSLQSDGQIDASGTSIGDAQTFTVSR